MTKRTPKTMIAAATATVMAAGLAVGLVVEAGGAVNTQADRSSQARTVLPAVGVDGVLSFGHLGHGTIKPRVKAEPRATPKPTPTSTSAPQPVTHPLSPAECRAAYGSPCYGAGELARTYGLDRLRRHGLTGGGQEVALIMPFHDPHLPSVLATYSRQYGLGAPRLTVNRPYGPVKTIDPSDPNMAVPGTEEELDAEMIRTTAPGARIRVIEVPGDWISTTNMTTAASAAAWAARRFPRVAVISMSYGWGEPNYREKGGGGLALLHRQDATLRRVTGSGVTLLAADGDNGPTTANLAETALYKHRAVYFPASSPSVTAVSGTGLHLRDSGTRRARDTVWADTSGQGAATGGGHSDVFARPAWQPRQLGNRRNVGDIALAGSDRSRIWFYSAYSALAGQARGWERVAGTSLSSPLLGGLVADAAQQAGHRLGNINPTLAGMHDARDGVMDVTSGSNTANGVTGFHAHPGPDTPTGIGTVSDALRFTTALAR